MRMTINIDPKYTEATKLSKFLKEKYNLKLIGVIKFLLMNEDILEELNKRIDKNDSEYRFQNRMEE